MVCWLAESWTKTWPTVSDLKISLIQRLRESGMLEWVCHLRPAHTHWEGAEDMPPK